MNETWEVVQRNRETGEEIIFVPDCAWNVDKGTAELGMAVRRMLCSEKWEVFIRPVKPGE